MWHFIFTELKITHEQCSSMFTVPLHHTRRAISPDPPGPKESKATIHQDHYLSLFRILQTESVSFSLHSLHWFWNLQSLWQTTSAEGSLALPWPLSSFKQINMAIAAIAAIAAMVATASNERTRRCEASPQPEEASDSLLQMKLAILRSARAY